MGCTKAIAMKFEFLECIYERSPKPDWNSIELCRSVGMDYYVPGYYNMDVIVVSRE